MASDATHASYRDNMFTGTLGKLLLQAATVGVVVYAAAIFGHVTRPVGHLSAFWPANALLLGLLVRNPKLAHPLTWLAAIGAYLAADLLMGSTVLATVLLSAANVAGAATGFLIYTRLDAADRQLKRPLSVLYMVLIVAVAASAAGIVGAIANPILFDGNIVEGFLFWFISELVTYTAILPVVLTLPKLRWPERRRAVDTYDLLRAGPALALLASCIASVAVGGPGAVAFPIPALLWCALTYGLFATSVLTLASSIWTLLALSTGLMPLSVDTNAWPTLMSIRIGVTLMALAPITVASITAARNELLERLQHLAAHDQLTGLLNRSAFRDRATALMVRLTVARQSAAVLMLDLDRFKTVNDTYGHAGGDEVLAEFTRIAASCLRQGDLFGRLGGEEFAVLLPNCGPDEAAVIAERIRAGLAGTSVELDDGRCISATVSIGIAFARSGFVDIDAMLLGADTALYRAKQNGRNRVELADAADTGLRAAG